MLKSNKQDGKALRMSGGSNVSLNSGAATGSITQFSDNQSDTNGADGQFAGGRFTGCFGRRPAAAVQKFRDLMDMALIKAKSLFRISAGRTPPPSPSLQIGADSSSRGSLASGGSTSIRNENGPGRRSINDGEARDVEMPPRKSTRFSDYSVGGKYENAWPVGDPNGSKCKKREREREATKILLNREEAVTVIDGGKSSAAKDGDQLFNSLERMNNEFAGDAADNKKYDALLCAQADDEDNDQVKSSGLLGIDPVEPADDHDVLDALEHPHPHVAPVDSEGSDFDDSGYLEDGKLADYWNKPEPKQE